MSDTDTTINFVIAIQNFPEGAIISMPLRAEGESKRKAFLGGVFSGVVEPIGAVMTILVAQLVIPALPYLLSFAAGAMLYVVVEELIPEMSQGRHSNIGTLFFAFGFSLMMIHYKVSDDKSGTLFFVQMDYQGPFWYG